MFYEVLINPAPNGFGLWQTQRCDEPWSSDSDLLMSIYDSCDGEIYNLHADFGVLPAEIEDIRGRILNEPERVYALVDKWQGESYVRYVGITEG